MKISIIQPDTIWEDKAANFRRLGELMEPLFNETDIVILPEMFNTGFSIKPDLLSETPDDMTFNWMSGLAKNGNFGLCGSYIVKEGGNYFNRWVFVSPDNELSFYNKRHLFSMSGEDNIFSKGRNKLIFSFRGFRICPFICYDLRFPVWSRNLNEYDLMINSANWPESRREVWNILLKARAIENQCYVAGANRVGIDGEGIKYCGESAIIDPKGYIIVSDNNYKERILTAEISLSELSEFRKKFPVSNDADNFSLEY
jgi:omega-amidase